MHYLMVCLLRGYFTKTLVIIDEIFVNYLNKPELKWDEFLSPISETCQPKHTVKFVAKNTETILGYESKYFYSTIHFKLN